MRTGTASDGELAESALETGLRDVEAAVADNGVLAHPYLVGWSQGGLSRDDLRAFATQYYRVVEALPRLVGQVYAETPDPTSRRELIAIMSAEDEHRPSTSTLWLRVCAALGLFSDTVRRAPTDSATDALVDAMMHEARRGTASGIGALLALTLQQPAVARMQRDALARHYDLHAGPVREYYERMEYAGIEHSARLRHVLGNTVRAGHGTPEHASAGTRASLAALHAWLDAVAATSAA